MNQILLRNSFGSLLKISQSHLNWHREVVPNTSLQWCRNECLHTMWHTHWFKEHCSRVYTVFRVSQSDSKWDKNNYCRVWMLNVNVTWCTYLNCYPVISETGSICFSFLKVALISFVFSSLYYSATLLKVAV